jgi:uncharacterized protein (TIGR00255 family)
MAVRSMTGFARVDGHDQAVTWFWEVRSVNGRGLDIRLRLPPGAEGLEEAVRRLAGERLTRGNVTIQLTQRRSEASSRIAINQDALDQILAISEDLREHLDSPPPTVEGLLGLRGVLESVEVADDEKVAAEREARQLSDLMRALDQLVAARESEGRRLAVILSEQIARVSELVETIEAAPARRPDAIEVRLSQMLERLVGEKGRDFDADRLHQEAVLIAAKADVEEELQRLRTHVDAARELLADGGAIGRRFDFLVQEFNREANTVCSKANDSEVTRAGLDMKAVIDQMREQVQNIE